MKLPHLLPALLLLSFAPLAWSQEEAEADPAAESGNASDTQGTDRFWQATLPGGHYMVALDRIATISRQEYILDATALVTEVTIDTNGRALARFYHIAPVTDAMDRSEASRIIERGRDLIDRAGQRTGTDIQNMAQKTYPATTHAGTIEYRILDLRDLDVLYNSLQRAWASGRGRSFAIK